MINDFASSLLKKYQSFVLPAVATLVSLAILGLLIIPEAAQLPQDNRDVQAVRDQVTKLSQKQATLDGINSTDYQNYVQTALTAIPSDQDVSGALDDVLFLLRNNNILLNNMNFALTGKPAPTLSNYAIKLDVTGQPSDIQNFLNSTKTIPRIVKVDDLDVEQAANKNAEVTTSINIYFQPLPTTIGSVNSPVNLPSQKDLSLIDEIKTQLENQQSTPTTASPSGAVGKADPFSN